MYAQKTHHQRRFALALLLLCGLGCPDTQQQTAPTSATCTELGARCKLPDGPLGVCNPVTCKPGQAEPCLSCLPQH